jgi:hypothetical protein
LRLSEGLRDTGRVEGYCTCGAKLPPDARFCHRCGRPLPGVLDVAEEPPLALEVPNPPPPALDLPPPPPLEINFHNGLAVRVAFLAAALAFLVGVMIGQIGFPILQFLMTSVVTAAGGFYAVFLYKRRSGLPLTPRNGARVGWITGIFGFVINIVVLTFGMLALAGKGGLAGMVRENADSMSLPPDVSSRMLEMLDNPGFLTMLVLFIVVFLFMTYTLSASLGGALGAKVLDRE